MSSVLALVLLVLVYLLTLASLDPWDVALGVGLAAGVLVWARRTLSDPSAIGAGVLVGRIARFPLFAGAIVREIVVGTWQVALVVVGVRRLSRPGIVAVPIGDRTPAGLAATALALTLSPGEVLVDIDRSRGVMLVHVIDAHDPDAVRARHDHFYRRYQRGVFP
jgi:multisubunit Na+/H+ antiporter MnhE subunit